MAALSPASKALRTIKMESQKIENYQRWLADESKGQRERGKTGKTYREVWAIETTKSQARITKAQAILNA